MLFKNIVAYELDKGAFPDSAEAFSDLLRPLAFTPLLGSEERRIGFAPPCEASDELVVSLGGDGYALSLRTDKKTIPASTLKRLVKEKADAIEQTDGYKPGRKQLKEIKKDLMHELLPKTLPATSSLFIIIKGQTLFIGASSVNAADNAVGIILSALKGIGLAFPFSVNLPKHMTQWLLDDHVSDVLTVGDFALLEGGGASVQWKNQEAEASELAKHINEGGKEAAKIGLEYRAQGSGLDPLSFCISAKGIISQIKVHESDDDIDSDEDADSDPMSQFLSNAAITASVSDALVSGIKDALGDNDM